MYYIFTLKNAQPIVLFKENTKIHMYSIISGRVRYKGLVFNDVQSDFTVFPGTPNKFYYITTKQQIRITAYYNHRFIELFSTSAGGNNSSPVINAVPVSANGEIYLFTLKKYNNENDFFLTCTTISDPLSEIKLFNISFTGFNVIYENKRFFILFKNNDSYNLCILDENLNILNNNLNINAFDEVKIEYENKISKLTEKLNAVSHQYDELSRYTGELLEKIKKDSMPYIEQ